RAPEWDDPRREQPLAIRVDALFEHHARRAVQLRHDHPLGAVDHERAQRREDRQLTEIDFLLDDVLGPLGLDGLAHFFHDHQLQRRLQRHRIGHVPLDAFLDRVLRLPEPVLHELEGVVPVHVLDREHVLEHPLQPDVGALGALPVRLQQRLERARLDVQEVRHRHPLLQLRERQYRQRLRHVVTSGKCKRPRRPRPGRRSGLNRGARTSEQECAKSAHVVNQRRLGASRRAGPYGAPEVKPLVYFSSTTAPCASSFFLISSASCLDTPSFTVPGAPSTRSLSSLRPRLVIARISLMTWISFSPQPFRMTVNSVFSSAAGAPAAPPAAPAAAGAAATGAAMVTPNFSLNFSISSASSTTDRLPMASMMSSLLNVCVAIVPVSYCVKEAPPPSAARLVRSASRAPTTFISTPFNAPRKPAIGAWSAPPSWASSSCFVGRLASRLTRSGVTVLPSTSPTLMAGFSNSLAKSASTL